MRVGSEVVCAPALIPDAIFERPFNNALTCTVDRDLEHVLESRSPILSASDKVLNANDNYSVI